ncbi:citrate synthase [Actinacidiphila bryophytorum]|uniref:citrate synthase n=1 Tax=Actinacidiphila bryophytorum TaxID=1436133 RepID=UPI001981493C|nr:citrate synthase [Actinacidiphila bryophytorum]MBN6546120.1 citrate synthase [Actinacidiphila bryophytorum]
MTDGAAGGGDARISTREAAARLGVKPETLYAYVSRGLLGSRRAAGGRGSTFDPGEVAALAARGRAATSTGSGAAQPSEPGSGSASCADGWGRIRTGITRIDTATGSYAFRGVDAVALAEAYAYEEVADWLWTGELRPGVRFTAPPLPLAAARAAAAALPAGSSPVDRMRVAVVAAGAADPLRFDLTREAVLGCTRGLIPTLVDALPLAGGADRGDAAPDAPAAGGAGRGDRRDTGRIARQPDAPAAGGAGGSGSVARRLWSRLTPREADPASLRVLDTALALLIDHDLATSTLAVRVAASGRAHPYAAVSAGLGALDGPLHGQASALAHRMLRDVLDQGGAGPVVAAHLRAGRRVPGLGHRLYRGEDPRARLLLARLADVPAAADALAAAQDTVATAARHTPLHANVDLALAVLSVASGMPAEAGEAVFAVGRTAGWVAHALEVYAEPAMRLRPASTYSGPPAPQPLPRAGTSPG